MINRTKGIMVFIIFMTVLTFGTGVKNWNSQNETVPVNPGIINPKNKGGKYEDNEANGDKKKKHSLKNKKNIERELKNNKGQSTETDEANLSNGNENPQNVDANNLNNAKNVKNDLNLRILKGNNDISELASILIGEELSNEMKLKVGDELSLV